MANTTGAEVAKLSVKVSPDTSKFYEELNRKLKAIEKALGKDGVDGGDVEVGTDKAEKKVAKSSKKMSNNLGALTKEAKKASTAVNKIKLGDISKDINRSISALDKYAGTFDVNKAIFWDPKEAKAALKALKAENRQLKVTSKAAKSSSGKGTESPTDRFQRRSLSDLASGMSAIEKNLHLTGAGEGLREDLDRAEKSLARMINLGPPMGSKQDVANWRSAIREQLDAVRDMAKGDAKAAQNFLGVSERQFDMIQRLGRIRKIAAEQDSKRDNAAHKDRMAHFAEELRGHKMRSDEVAAFLKQLEAEKKAKDDAEVQRKALVLSDPFNKKAMSDLKKAYADASAALPNTFEGEEARQRLQQDVDRIQREIEADIPVDLHVRAGERERLRKEIEKIANGGAAGGGKGGGRGGIFAAIGAGGGGGFNFSKLMPSFGSGINPAGYVAIIAALALVAAPLVGLVSTLVLAIPGMISAIVTPMMAIGLGMDGIKRAGANSGLFKYDDEGKLEGLGAVFDKVKTNVSAAFDEGLTPALKTLASAIDPLLGSLPKVATGLTDMFQGFIDSLTSSEGMALFDDTIKNIGAAMSAAAPGIKSFTDGMLGIANSFSLQLPKFSTWLNTTGDSFAKWVTEMTTVPDPAGHHGPNPNGKTPMDLAFEGLGGTLKTIGDWAVDMGQAGLKFVQDPKKMQDFLGTLDSIGAAITKLIDLGNKLGPVWALANGDDFGNAPGVQNLPKPKETEAAVQAARAAAEEANRAKGVEPTPQAEESWLSKLGGLLTKGLEAWMAPAGTRVVGDSVVKTNIAPNELAANVKGQIDALNERIAGMESDMAARVADGKPAVDPILGDYKVRIQDLQDDLAELKAIEASLSPQVALKSFESPLPVSEGGKPSFVNQLLTDLKGIPTAAVPAKDAIQQVKETGVMTPEALGQLSQNAQTATVPEAPTEIPAPDTSAFDAAIQELPTSTTTAMQGVADAVTTGGQTAAGNMLLVGQQMVANIQTFTGLFQTAGQQMMMGLANGITVGTAWVVAAARSAAKAAHDAAKEELEINSPSKKFIEIGLSTMEGMSKGMEGGVQPVIDKAADLADKVSAAFADGSTDPTALLAGMSNKEINQMEKVLGYQEQSLRAQISGMSYRNRKVKDPGVEAEIQKLKDMETELGLQKQMIDLAQDFAGIDDKSSGEDPFVKAASGLLNSPADFAKATGKQFMSDLGIGGNGLIGNAITEGISYIFNIASVDEALSLKDREDSKAAQSNVGR